MLGWLNKKLKVWHVRSALAQYGIVDVYPDTVLRDIIEETFFVTKCLSESSFSGSAFDFDGNWNFYLSPFIKLLYANAIVSSIIANTTDAILSEALKKALKNNADAFAGVDTSTADNLHAVLLKHGLRSHITEIRPLL
ncbi:hypothetical protein [Sphingomonas sp.]|uniref:hypothetical protein n=1 Tax=Sphingomonas sp. TaxID=28214 RepID=UPI0025F8035D|nr:hypothetical protein [Sphingomonas sp.]